MITEEQLLQFCAKEDIRLYMLTPYIQDGYVVATNGHICIRTTGEFESAITHEDVKPADICGLIDKTITALEGVASITLPHVRDATPCKSCNGTGLEFVCQKCDGEGDDDEGEPCEACGASGISAKKTDKTRDCWFCEGTGEDLSEPVECGDAWFRRRYLEMIKNLPGAMIKTNGEIGVAYFAFNGGDGAVMPTRRN